MIAPAQGLIGLEERWRDVLDGLADAVRRAGREPGSVCLVAVSKYQPAEAVAELARLGQRDFGENYIQEARAKQAEVAAKLGGEDASVRWHAIGPIQTNKVKDVAGHFALIHSLASVRLAEALGRKFAGTGEVPARSADGAAVVPAVQDALIQVNIGEEPQKAGISPAKLPALVEALMPVAGIRVRGLMCLPPHCGEGEAARSFFVRLRCLRDEQQQRFGLHLPHLSMGMSGDYRQAVDEGATLVRVGTDIFGPRPVKP